MLGRFYLFTILIAALTGKGFAAQPNLVQLCPEVAKAPVVDGKFSHGEWESAVGVSGFICGPYAQVVDVQTVVYAQRTKKALYLGFYMEEPNGGNFNAKITNRDGRIWWEHNIQFFIDVQHRQNKEFFHFIVTGINTQYDAIGVSKAWNGEWKSARKRGKGFEFLEVEIPFKTIGRFPRSGEMWGINYTRLRSFEPNDKWDNVSYWADVQGDYHAAKKFGHIWFGSEKQLCEQETLDGLVINMLGPIRVFLRDGYLEHSESSVTTHFKYLSENQRMKNQLNQRLKDIVGDHRNEKSGKKASNMSNIDLPKPGESLSVTNRNTLLISWAHLLRAYSYDLKQVEQEHWTKKVEKLYRELGR